MYNTCPSITLRIVLIPISIMVNSCGKIGYCLLVRKTSTIYQQFYCIASLINPLRSSVCMGVKLVRSH